jgi:RNA polymerase sigma factor (sigma-70 family)
MPSLASLRTARPTNRLTLSAEETDSFLLSRVRDVTDAASWREFVQRYEPLLLSYVRGRGLQEHDARDVVQEVFTRLHRALPTFHLNRERGRFRTWLYQVASSALTDWVRVRQRQVRAEQAWRERQETGGVVAPSQSESLSAERRRVLEMALTRLRAQSQPKTWACFEQRILRGRASAAVAAELGLTANAVNVNAARTLARLRKQCVACRKEVADESAFLPCGA